ncbi:12515_t:CDS:2 [Gigaspora rosea]|nr:12515_t:CDS:2 [Gigaspora rosea]
MFWRVNSESSYTEFLDATKPYDPIVIDISDPSASQKLAQSRRRRNVNPPSLKVKVLGGDGLYNDRAGSCSVGLWVYDNDGFYIITAGHCYEPGVWFHQPWGHNGPSLSIGSMDLDLVVVHGIHITGGAAAEPIDQFQ